MAPKVVKVRELTELPLTSDEVLALCYPRPSEFELRSRVTELLELGVEELIFDGPVTIGKVPVVGKGCVGIVVKCRIGGEVYALKIRRVDANRDSMEYEANMLKLANSVNVGPRLVKWSKNFLIREFIEGEPIGRWIVYVRDEVALRSVLRELLEQCYRLDSIGLYHAQLSDPSNHVIIDCNQRPHIIDFETASTTSRKSNVTAVTQFFFLRPTEISKKVKSILHSSSNQEILAAAREYKRTRSRSSFSKLLKVLNLT
ncbi:MAG: serine/threonine protein kinase [Thermoprotei archaeon]|nr:MAG: serine/threonine protein kinase [Thermoprotei archaeon]